MYLFATLKQYVHIDQNMFNFTQDAFLPVAGPVWKKRLSIVIDDGGPSITAWNLWSVHE